MYSCIALWFKLFSEVSLESLTISNFFGISLEKCLFMLCRRAKVWDMCERCEVNTIDYLFFIGQFLEFQFHFSLQSIYWTISYAVVQNKKLIQVLWHVLLTLLKIICKTIELLIQNSINISTLKLKLLIQPWLNGLALFSLVENFLELCI